MHALGVKARVELEAIAVQFVEVPHEIMLCALFIVKNALDEHIVDGVAQLFLLALRVDAYLVAERIQYARNEVFPVVEVQLEQLRVIKQIRQMIGVDVVSELLQGVVRGVEILITNGDRGEKSGPLINRAYLRGDLVERIVEQTENGHVSEQSAAAHQENDPHDCD